MELTRSKTASVFRWGLCSLMVVACNGTPSGPATLDGSLFDSASPDGAPAGLDGTPADAAIPGADVGIEGGTDVSIEAGASPDGSGPPADVVVHPGQSITGAIAGASVGDTIGLAPGSYFEKVVIKKAVTLRAEVPGEATIDGGTDQLVSWTAAGANWQTNLGWNPGLVVVDHLVLFDNDFLPRGMSYSGGTVTLRTGGVDPNTVLVSVCERPIGIEVLADDVTIEGLRVRAHREVGILVQGDRFTLRDTFIEGSRYGVDMGVQRGAGHLIEYNEVSNYPYYTDSYVDDSNLTTWKKLYNAKVLDSEMTSFRFGSLDTTVRHNYAYEMMDGMQPRKQQPGPANNRTEVYKNLVHNSRDDAVEFDSNGPQNLRFHHNFILNSLAGLAASPVNFGPVLIDHNINVHTKEWGLNKAVMFKFDGSWSKDIHRNLRIVHNTVKGWPSNGLYWTEPLGASKVHAANNLIDITGSTSWPSAFSTSNNHTGPPGFISTSPLNFGLTASSPARNSGSTQYDDFHDYTDGKPDCGALEQGSAWDFGKVGPRWATAAKMPQRPPLPKVIAPKWVGL